MRAKQLGQFRHGVFYATEGKKVWQLYHGYAKKSSASLARKRIQSHNKGVYMKVMRIQPKGYGLFQMSKQPRFQVKRSELKKYALY